MGLASPTPEAIYRALGTPGETTSAAWYGFFVAIGSYLVSRVAVIAAAKIATWAAPTFTTVGVLAGWDAYWYLRIARDGYPSHLVNEHVMGNRWSFFPALPLLIRGMHALTGLSVEACGVVIAFVFGLTAAVATYLALRTHFGSRAAGFGVALMCFFPSAYVFSMIYTEGLFVTLAALCLYCLDSRRWVLAGIAAAASGTVRLTSVAVVACCVVAAVHEAAVRRSFRAASAALIAPLGLLGWMAYGWSQTGTPFASIETQSLWYQQFVWFQTPFIALWHVVRDRHYWSNAQEVQAAGALVFVGIGMALTLGASWSGRLRLPPAWWTYIAAATLLAFSPYWATSVARYVLVVFPLFAAVAARLRPTAGGLVLGASGTLLGAISTVAFSTLPHWETAPFAP